MQQRLSLYSVSFPLCVSATAAASAAATNVSAAAATHVSVSAATAVTVTAYGKENNESDDNEPYYLILKKIAKAVHIYFLSFNYVWRIGDFTLQYNDM